MNEAAAAGEWISIWVSPLAYFLFDVLFAVLVLVVASAFRAARRARHKEQPLA